jgi:hypothetical protein
MMHSIKILREKGIAALKLMSVQLIKSSVADATVEGRRKFVEEAKLIRCVEEVTIISPPIKR